MLTRAVALALLVLSTAAPAMASAVVVLGGPGRIVIGADSRRVRADGHSDSVCKVQSTRRPDGGLWWLTHAGISGGHGVDLPAISLGAIASARRLADVERALNATVYPAVRGLLERAVSSPVSAHMVAGDGAPNFQLVIAGVEGGAPAAGVFVVFVHRTAPLELSSRWLTCPGPESGWCERDGRTFYATAVSEGPLTAAMRERPAWLRANVPAALRLLRAQHEASPDEVSGADVLEITAAGARWAHRDADSRCRSLSSK